MVETNKTVVIRMSEDLYNEIQPILQSEHKSFSGLVRDLLEKKLEDGKTVVIDNKDLAKIFTEDKFNCVNK